MLSKADLGSRHNYLWQLNVLSSNRVEDVLKFVDNGNQLFHDESASRDLTDISCLAIPYYQGNDSYFSNLRFVLCYSKASSRFDWYVLYSTLRRGPS